jgi:sugar O-acyltransferase (sialic acid O-acetyltransferase NeuD family)
MSALRKIVLVGGGGTTSDVVALIHSINQFCPKYEILGLLDDVVSINTTRFGYPILGGFLTNTSFPEDVFFVDCLGSTRSYLKRESIIKKAGFNLDRFETIIHPSVFISANAKVGRGSIIYPNVVVLSNVTIGQHVIVLSGSVLNHDVTIGDWSILASGVMLSGAVNVGDTCYLGSASTIREEINIGSGSLVGMGAAVVNHVANNQVVVGVPAKSIRNQK